MKIKEFAGSHRFLSNFANSSILVDEKYYPTVEHYFQANKTIVEAEFEAIRTAETPGRAKRLGRKCTLRPYWDNIKDEVMMKGLRAKFARPEFRKRLLATGDSILEEGNTWGDVYWGKNITTGEGQNKLGQLLMQLRDEIKDEERKRVL